MSSAVKMRTPTCDLERDVAGEARARIDQALRAHRSGKSEWRDIYLDLACELFRAIGDGPMMRWCRNLQRTGVMADFPGTGRGD